MKTMRRMITGVGLTIALSLTQVQSQTFGQEIKDEQSQEAASANAGKAPSITGTWDVRVTILNCQTGDAIRTFRAMSQFHGVHTLLETSAGVLPTVRGPGLGTWKRLGRRRFSAFFRFNPDASFAGTQQVTRKIKLSKDGKEFTATGVFEIFDAEDNLLQSGCTTETATRLDQ
jgi:hypothetical protein